MSSSSRFFIIGLPQLPTNNDPKVEPDLRDSFNAIRNLAYLVGQYGGFEPAESGRDNIANVAYTAGPYKRRVYCVSLEALAYGQLVNLTNTAGVLNVRAANATNNTRPCYGVNNTVGTCAIGATIEVALPGCYVTSIGGLTPGTRYFLSTTDGLLTNVVPAVAGNVQQAIGFALDANTLFFQPEIQWTVV